MTEMPVRELADSEPAVTVTEPLPRSWPWYSDHASNEVWQRVRDGDVYAFGRHETILELETWAREFFEVRHALAVGSGTAALASAYFALGLQPHDEILVPTYTFHATCAPLFRMGVTPVLYDCDPTSARADIADLERRITPATRAVVVTHMFGLPAEMDEVMLIARRHGLAVIEDAAQAHGAYYRGRYVGTFGDVGCLSLGGQKMITGGMGGLILTDREDIYEKSLCLGHAHERAEAEIAPQSEARKYAEMGFGGNLRMHPLAAVLALDHCQSFSQRVKTRTEVLLGLTASLREFGFLSPPEVPADCTRGGWYGYKVRYRPERIYDLPLETFVAMLRKRGLAVSIPTTRPLHQLFPFSATEGQAGRGSADRHGPGHGAAEYPGATALYAATVSFPDKHLHEPADRLLTQYVAAIADVSRVVRDAMRRSAGTRLAGVELADGRR
jgi:perosamine synthetase